MYPDQEQTNHMIIFDRAGKEGWIQPKLKTNDGITHFLVNCSNEQQDLINPFVQRITSYSTLQVRLTTRNVF